MIGVLLGVGLLIVSIAAAVAVQYALHYRELAGDMARKAEFWKRHYDEDMPS